MNLVLTNGCFDILHAGHVDFLRRARELGDRLIVGINDDRAVRKLKGRSRPVNPYADRAFVLSAIRWVDQVYPLHYTDVVRFLLRMRPQIWVKGGDYTLATLNPDEVAAAKQVGAKIVILPIKYRLSTTGILKQL